MNRKYLQNTINDNSQIIRERGDILQASNRSFDAGWHYIVFYEGYDDVNFIGAMVTHLQSDKNIAMAEFHFENIDENQKGYKFQYDNTNLVVAKLKKFIDWGPFVKVGKLTKDGNDFVSQVIDHLNEETWEEYCERTNRT